MMRHTGRTMNIGGSMALPPDATVEEMAAVLRFVLGRHQALRSRLLFPAAPDEGARPRQEVFASGEAALHVIDVDEDDDAAAVAEATRWDYEMTPFDYAAEWPVRMAVVRQAGTLTHLVVQYGHVMVDGTSLAVVSDDLRNLDPATGAAAEPLTAVTPLELARMQAGPAGRRQSAKSLRYWQGVLEGIEARRFGESDDPREPRFWEILCYSPAMHLGLESVAARTGVATSQVLLAAYAIALARITGRNPSVAHVVVNNRFRPGMAQSVAQISQSSLCAIDVADCTFDDAVARAWKAGKDALMHGYYDHDDHAALLADVERRRGERVDISCYVNDRRGPDQPGLADRVATEEELRAALKRTRLRWDRKFPTYDGSLFLHVDPGPDGNVPDRDRPDEREQPAVYISLWVDTHCLAPAEIEAFARDLEAVIVEGALDPKAHSRVYSAG